MTESQLNVFSLTAKYNPALLGLPEHAEVAVKLADELTAALSRAEIAEDFAASLEFDVTDRDARIAELEEELLSVRDELQDAQDELQDVRCLNEELEAEVESLREEIAILG